MLLFVVIIVFNAIPLILLFNAIPFVLLAIVGGVLLGGVTEGLWQLSKGARVELGMKFSKLAFKGVVSGIVSRHCSDRHCSDRQTVTGRQ